MNAHEMDHEAEAQFDIDVELSAEDDAPWAAEADIVELSPARED